ncbi:MAG: hypothetical protein RLZZ393_1697 [Pseudomonadota bacterium]|jgi:hypothetical protein
MRRCGILAPMERLRAAARQWWFRAAAAGLGAGLCAWCAKPALEHAVRDRIEEAARRHGMVARFGAVHLGLWPLLRLQGVTLDLGHGSTMRAEAVSATWGLPLRISVRGAALKVPGGVEIRSPATAWRVGSAFGDELRLTLLEPQAGLAIRRMADPAGHSTWSIEIHDLHVGRLLDIRRNAMPLLDGGLTNGQIGLESDGETLRFHVDLAVRGLRAGALAGNAADDPQLGEPTDVTLRCDGNWQRKSGQIDIPEIHAGLAGAELSGSLALPDLDTDPGIDLALGLRQMDFAQLMGASGLEVPDSLGLPAGHSPGLGAASFDVQVRGRLADPASFAVTQKIAFAPPRELPPGITRLRDDFVFTPVAGTGQDTPIDVSSTSPDFIALKDVPPLFLRTLLLAEDAGFYGHRGIDLREMPAALITNWSRGGAARGASTISQQLAKNLFLARDKQVGRKLQELALTFLLESALGKERILEIYLNIIEWGPGLRGLRPAARHYFNREPGALTPAQIAFLVSIIPGPILYQRSLAEGTPGPGLRVLIDKLLAKLRSVEAISEAEYQQALADPLSLTP